MDRWFNKDGSKNIEFSKIDSVFVDTKVFKNKVYDRAVVVCGGKDFYLDYEYDDFRKSYCD